MKRHLIYYTAITPGDREYIGERQQRGHDSLGGNVFATGGE